MGTLLQDGVPNPANKDETCKDSLRMSKTSFKTELQVKAQQSNIESPMTITASGSSQDQVMNKRKSGSAMPRTTLKQAVKKQKQPQGYNLGYFSLWWSRMEREGAKKAVVSTRRH